MANKAAMKRKAPTGPPAASKGKGKAVALVSTGSAQPSRKRAKLAAGKQSNRPRADLVDSDSDGDEPAVHSPTNRDEGQNEADDAQAAMLAALEAHQASFFSDALPFASTSSGSGAGPSKKERTSAATQKSVWEMDDDDFLDDEDDDDDEDDEESQGEGEQTGGTGNAAKAARASSATVVAFVEPGRGPAAALSAGETAPPPMSKREMRDFKAGKVKNLHVKPSIADAHNVKYVGGKAAKQKAAAAAGDTKAVASLEKQAEEEVEESHLSKLDSHLSSLIQPLTSGTGGASLPDLLRELPIASSKPLKGHTPLPKNAPRMLRRGQNAANLKRAQARDDAAGFGKGAKKGAVGMGREALSLKEKRRAEGGDKRQRGIGAAAGKWGRGQISLSKKEIRSINGPE